MVHPAPSILVLIAAYNEESGIGPTLNELNDTIPDSQFMVVDGNSIDKTVEVAKNNGAEVIFQEGTGKGNAISQAIQTIDFNPKYVIFTDADYTYPVSRVNEMIDILDSNPEIGMVVGSRFSRMFIPKSMTHPLYLGNRFLALAQFFLNGIKLSDPLSGLRVVRWSIIKNWRPRSRGFDIEVEMNHHIERSGYRIVEVPINYRNRLGEKKLKIKHGFKIFMRIVSESLTHHTNYASGCTSDTGTFDETD